MFGYSKFLLYLCKINRKRDLKSGLFGNKTSYQ